jgi:apolipoprotein N-acyltransferase
MGKTLKQTCAKYLPSLLSGILLVLSFPVFDLYAFAWIAFVPLLLSLWEKNPKETFVAGFLFGVTYFFGTLYWIYHSINHYGGVSFFTSICLVLLLCGYLSLYPALFSYLFSSVVKKTKLPAVFIVPVFWVVLEFLRSYALSGFPWASIGYSQYTFLSLIQISDLTGIYGVSFLVLAFNGAVVDILLLKKRIHKMPLFPLSYTVVGISILILIMISTFSYGKWRLDEKRPGKAFRVSIVQGNIEQDKKWEPAYQNDVINIYTDLSKQAALASADLIVWPETAVPFFFEHDVTHTENIINMQKDLDAYLLLGSVMIRERSPEQNLLSNSAILLDKKGKKTYEYDKIHLVPFGEYVPFRKLLFFIDKLVVGVGNYRAGKEYPKAETEFGRFGTLICYEIIFPGKVRKFYTDGGDFMVTITNDAWFGMTHGPHQHFSMAVFRAIENRKPVIRSANTGVSGFIDSSGKILATTPLFQRMVMNQTIQTDRTMTFYTKYGDLFSYFCMVISVIILINTKLWR